MESLSPSKDEPPDSVKISMAYNILRRASRTLGGYWGNSVLRQKGRILTNTYTRLETAKQSLENNQRTQNNLNLSSCLTQIKAKQNLVSTLIAQRRYVMFHS